MTTVFVILAVQALLGGFDNLWHHELQARLPQRASARHELSLHAAREGIYAVVFFGLAWFRWQGAFAVLLAALLVLEVAITLADFLEEDRSRRLPPLERVLHTLLALGLGVFLAAFCPVLVDWVGRPTAMVAVDHGGFSWLFTVCAAGVAAWGIRNAIAVYRLTRQVAAEARIVRPLHPRGPAILVTGATGFIGSALIKTLLGDGKRVIVLSRDPLQARATFGAGVWVLDRLDDIPSETMIDAVVNLAGAPILGAPWTARRRQFLIDSRVDTTSAVVLLIRRLEHRPRVLVSASAVGYYGLKSNNSAVYESSPPEPGRFQSDLCAAAEHEARRAEALNVRVVRLRFGIVLGRGGGAYPAQALAARLGLGAVLGDGQQPVPWIHLDDATGLIRFAIAREGLSGAVNATALEVPTQAEFADALARSFGRRVRLRIPGWPLRMGLGELSELLLCGQKAIPRAATLVNYDYRHPTLASAVGDLS